MRNHDPFSPRSRRPAPLLGVASAPEAEADPDETTDAAPKVEETPDEANGTPTETTEDEETASDASDDSEAAEEATTDPADYEDMNKDELVTYADERGVDSGGKKAEIIERLREADDASDAANE